MLTWGIPIRRDKLIGKLKGKHEEVIPKYSNTNVGRYSINGIISELAYYSINSRFKPKSGSYWTVQHEQGLRFRNSGIRFSRTTIDAAKFVSMTQKSILGMHFNLGLFNSKENEIKTFESEQFIIGGTYSLRGYNENNYPFSGEKKILFNIELRQEIVKKLEGVLFYDLGNVFKKEEKVEMGQLHYGYGIGLRYFTPVGPIRLDFAKNDSGDYRFHFGLGQLF